MRSLLSKKTLLLSFLSILLFSSLHAQDMRLIGTLISAGDNSTLVGGTIKLASARDTIHPYYATSDADGKFVFEGLKKGRYILNVTYIGFNSFTKTMVLTEKLTDLGKITIDPSVTTLKEFGVVSKAVRAEQKADTAQYNADAFKVTKDATTEDLIKKMPGISIENGTIKAQGEDVKKVLVDGKAFFGDDASATLKNLPAEVVDKIQVFDKLSDQAAWTGFDDGNSQKTLNIVTRRNKNQGTFGKMSAGYGLANKESMAKDPYQANINLNFFKDQRKLTFIVASNNINDQNFGSGDFMGSGGFGGGGMRNMGGGRGGGSSNGITTTNALGVNFSNSWGTKLAVSGSYFYNKGDSKSYSTSERAYIPENLPYKFMNQDNTSTSLSQNHRMNLRLEYTINDRNSLIWTPRFNIQKSENNSLIGQIFKTTDSIPFGSTFSDNYGSANGINANNEISYRYKFFKTGRTFSITIANAINDVTRKNYIDNLELNVADTSKQYSNTVNTGHANSGNIVYTEPISLNSQLQLNYNISYSTNKNDKKTYDYDGEQQGYTKFNNLLSNFYTNNYTTHKPGVGYLYKTTNVTLNAGLSYQYAILNGDQTFPVLGHSNKSFSSILPSFMLNYKFSDYMNLRAFYRANSNAPSVTQLQQVVDNSNPVFVTIGNPDLKQEVRHFSTTRFSLSNKTKTSNFFGMLFLSKTINAISNAIYYAPNDTIIYGIELKKGGQLTRPVNLEGSWSGRTLITYGFPVSPIKCNLNFNTGFSYNNSPTLIDNNKNTSGTYGINEGVVLSSNISENLDFTLTYNFTYNLVKNSLQTKNDNNYIFQIASTNFRWQFWKNLFVQTNLTYQNYNTMSTKVITDYTLWNASMGSKLFKDKSGEIKLTAFDILNQNTSFSHNVSESYVENVNSLVLTQYFILTFTYNLRKFTGEMPQNKEGDDHQRFDRMRGSGGMPPGMPPGIPHGM